MFIDEAVEALVMLRWSAVSVDAHAAVIRTTAPTTIAFFIRGSFSAALLMAAPRNLSSGTPGQRPACQTSWRVSTT
jgi:hypothetical protein